MSDKCATRVVPKTRLKNHLPASEHGRVASGQVRGAMEGGAFCQGGLLGWRVWNMLQIRCTQKLLKEIG